MSREEKLDAMAEEIAAFAFDKVKDEQPRPAVIVIVASKETSALRWNFPREDLPNALRTVAKNFEGMGKA